MNLSELDTTYTLTPEHIEYYQKHGYIKLKQVLSQPILDYFNEEISREVHARNPLLKKPMEERSTYEQAFIQIGNLWTENDIVQKLVLSKRLGQIASDLMKVKGVRLYHDQALYKEPTQKVKNFTPWHADQFYWPLDTKNTVTAWIPLQETTLNMGPLAFSMGSQNVEVGRDMAISDESEAMIQQQLADANLETDNGPFDAGEISFHGGWTYHRAGPNTSDKVRAVMTIIYMEDGISVSELERPEHKDDRDAFLPGLNPGDLAATQLNPQIFTY
ncbi:MAG: phytanoyl-CoA dioxygenase family protein [Bacteroidota bacterium]